MTQSSYFYLSTISLYFVHFISRGRFYVLFYPPLKTECKLLPCYSQLYCLVCGFTRSAYFKTAGILAVRIIIDIIIIYDKMCNKTRSFSSPGRGACVRKTSVLFISGQRNEIPQMLSKCYIFIYSLIAHT